MENPEETVLRNAGEETLIGRKGELVQTARADRPARQRISRRFALLFEKRNGKILLLVLDLRINRLSVRIRLIGQILVEYVQSAAGERGAELIASGREPFDTSDFGFIEETLRETRRRRRIRKMKFTSRLTFSLKIFCSLLCKSISWICPLENPVKIFKLFVSTF